MRCRACRDEELVEVFAMEPMPLAGAFAKTAKAAKAMPKYPLTWLQCGNCGLVNVEPDIPDKEIYAAYSYSASTVPALVRHHAELAEALVGRFGRHHADIVEIGCNDGVLLRQLPEDWHRYGVDPSDVALGDQGDWTLLNYGFDAVAADMLLAMQPDGFDVVVASNSFAHFTGIAEALESITRILRPGGEFWVEVHDLAATVRSAQWDTIYHEHKVEWSRASLTHALNLYGLQPISIETLPLHGGLIRGKYRNTGQRRWMGRSKPTDLSRLRQAYERRSAPVLAPHSAAYGAAARATVYLNQMRDLPIDYVVDGSPLRAGKFVPGLGIPVVPPEDFGDPPATLITAWNHAEDIKARHPGYERWVTAW